jgi:hypothetical protein
VSNEEKILMMLDQINKRLDEMPTRNEVSKGFDRLENLINVAAKDAARTEKALREHIEQPVH